MLKLKAKFDRLKSSKRIYQLEKPVIGLTGGIATGKSTVSSALTAKGIKIIDADLLVKKIYETTEAKIFVSGHFPEAFTSGQINFPKLREMVFSDKKMKKAVEEFIYSRLPFEFLKATQEIKNQDFYIYDVPLLFEKHLDLSVDMKVLVYAPREIQLARIIDRDKSREETAKAILDQQMDIEDKKLKADYIINNSSSMVELTAEIEQFLLHMFE